MFSMRWKSRLSYVLNEVEVEIELLRQNLSLEEDIPLWKQADDKYASKFITHKKRGNSCGSLIKPALGDAFTTDWNELIGIISNPRFTLTKAFILMYTFQATMHTIWWERNLRRHGEQPRDIHCLTKIVDKTVTLRLLSVKGKGHRYLDESLTTWYEFRQDS
ncbi:hypothetical protein F2Q70_00023685 [Brassica cretica]|uniref:Uncharacterized protein n=1 Tax=Brassica cretica TaxID=69181 RepID=A0A8S9GYQ8_BRACR|nr:hypothetical protein F2Q70_00023685 [Brassica cretica]